MVRNDRLPDKVEIYPLDGDAHTAITQIFNSMSRVVITWKSLSRNTSPRKLWKATINTWLKALAYRMLRRASSLKASLLFCTCN